MGAAGSIFPRLTGRRSRVPGQGWIQAELDGFEYVWYKDAQVCYAYLSDVSEKEPHSLDSDFAKSRWLTRGWTLQELIAPLHVEFYGKDWLEIGTKLSLQDHVSAITGVPVTALNYGNVERFSVAQRMSWASLRQTTRVEDKAYCLMGLFGANMPMLYGEGEKAFCRLQEEIMKASDDQTLFCWTETTQDRLHWRTRGFLADSPAEFVEAGDICPSDPVLRSDVYFMTNRGLRIDLPLFLVGDSIYFAVLNCQRSSGADEMLGIYLEKDTSGKEENFSRLFVDVIDTIPKKQMDGFEQKTIYIVRKSIDYRTQIEHLWGERPATIYQGFMQAPAFGKMLGTEASNFMADKHAC